jgi:hypothetical protein
MKTKRTSRPQSGKQHLALMDQAMDACRTAGTIAHLLEVCGADRAHSMLPVSLAADAGGIIRHEMNRLHAALTALHEQGRV